MATVPSVPLQPRAGHGARGGPWPGQGTVGRNGDRGVAAFTHPLGRCDVHGALLGKRGWGLWQGRAGQLCHAVGCREQGHRSGASECWLPQPGSSGLWGLIRPFPGPCRTSVPCPAASALGPACSGALRRLPGLQLGLPHTGILRAEVKARAPDPESPPQPQGHEAHFTLHPPLIPHYLEASLRHSLNILCVCLTETLKAQHQISL